MTISCENCQDEYPDDEPMIYCDTEVFCSYNCLVDYIDIAFDKETKTHSGLVEATRSYNDRITAILSKGEEDS